MCTYIYLFNVIVNVTVYMYACKVAFINMLFLSCVLRNSNYKIECQMWLTNSCINKDATVKTSDFLLLCMFIKLL